LSDFEFEVSIPRVRPEYALLEGPWAGRVMLALAVLQLGRADMGRCTCIEPRLADLHGLVRTRTFIVEVGFGDPLADAPLGSGLWSGLGP
jgi:hypothetical protein